MTKPFVNLSRRLRPLVTVLPLRARVIPSLPFIFEILPVTRLPLGAMDYFVYRTPGTLTRFAWRPRDLGFSTHQGNVGFGQFISFNDRSAQVPFALAGFGTQQVLLSCLPSLEFSLGSHAQALFRTLVGFHFGHGRYRS